MMTPPYHSPRRCRALWFTALLRDGSTAFHMRRRCLWSTKSMCTGPARSLRRCILTNGLPRRAWTVSSAGYLSAVLTYAWCSSLRHAFLNTCYTTMSSRIRPAEDDALVLHLVCANVAPLHGHPGADPLCCFSCLGRRQAFRDRRTQQVHTFR